MSESHVLRVGMLGFGFMGKTHLYGYRTIPLYYNPPPASVELRVICTSRAETAVEAMRFGGFERWTLDPAVVIQADDVDVINICTPNHLHADALEAALKAGKHIYVDKPVTANLEEARRLEPLLTSYRGTAQVALQYRFFPASLRARELVEAGLLGPVTHFRAVYLHSGSVDPLRPVNWKSTARAGGGVIRDLGPHVLDLLDWMIGPFEAVQCVSRIWAAQRPDADRSGAMMSVDVEDAAAMLLRSPDGAFGTVEVSKIATGAEDELRLEIHGRHGALRLNLADPNHLEIYDGRLPEGVYGGGRGWQRIDTRQKYPGPGAAFPGGKMALGWLRAHVHSLYAFLHAVTTGAEARPSLADGLHLQRILETVRRSAEEGRWLDLPRRA